MRKLSILLFSAVLLLSSCGTYMGTGTYIGAEFGSILGSAIGGISNGGRGSDVGTIIGMAGGAVIGGAIGNAKDKANRKEVHDHYAAVMQQKAEDQMSEDAIYDDIIYDFDGPDYTSDYSAAEPQTNEHVTTSNSSVGFTIKSPIEIRNARFVDDNRDNVMTSDELCKVIFEVVNASENTLYDLVPMVEETTGNKRIFISPTVHVEALAAGKAIRYTAMVKADKLKDGKAHFNIYVNEGSRRVSPIQEFSIETRKK